MARVPVRQVVIRQALAADLFARKVPVHEIAAQMSVSTRTVTGWLRREFERQKAELLGDPFEAKIRAKMLYEAVAKLAGAKLQNATSRDFAPIAGVVLKAQERIDAVLGTEAPQRSVAVSMNVKPSPQQIAAATQLLLTKMKVVELERDELERRALPMSKKEDDDVEPNFATS